MLRTVTLGGLAAAALSSGCCWRPFCGPGPAMYNPPPAPLFPRLHPSYWATPPATPVAAPVAHPGGPAGPDCPGCVGGLPPGAVPYGAAPMPGAGYAMANGPVTVSPPPGMLAGGPLFSPTYFGPPSVTATGSTLLPTPKPVGEPPAVMPSR